MLYEVVFVSGMILAAGWDLAHRRVPNVLSVAILAAGLCARALQGGGTALTLGLGGAALGLGLLLVPFAAGWLGGGDVKLAAAAGAWLGPRAMLAATLGGLLLGGLIALGLLVRAPRRLRREVLANLRHVVLLARLPAVPARPAAAQVPLATALAVAAIATRYGMGG
jgi:prepilin peptidase CpaA